MSDRGVLFVFSLIAIVACLVVAVWLVASGQARSVDGLFLLLSSLVIALAFVLYMGYVIKSAMAATRAPASEKAVPATAAKPAPAAAAAAPAIAGKAR